MAGNEVKHRVDEVKRRALLGSRNAFSQLLDMVLSRVPGAREALMEVHSELANGKNPEEADREAFWGELRDAMSLLNQEPTRFPEGLRERARGIGVCEEVQALGLEAYRARLFGHLSSARRTLEEAWDIGRRCSVRGTENPCRLDTGRRRAVLASVTGDHDGALRLIELSLEGYRNLGEAGHDLDGDGLASCLSARGKIRYFLGDYSGAADDLAASLHRVHPGSRTFWRRQINLGVVLLKTSAEDREKVYQLLRKPRLALRNLPLRCVERAFFDWLDGQLELDRPDNKNRNRGCDKICNAVGIFAEHRMPDEFLSSAADYMMYLRQRNKRDEIREFVMRTLRPVVEGGAADGTEAVPPLITAPEHRRRLNAILLECHGRPTAGSWERLRRAIEDLRSSASGANLLPCLVS